MSYSQPLVTILLPVYNGERTIKATLESLLAQTYTNFEVLIGIDGTKDGSKTIAESFTDSRIQIIEHPINLGLAENINSLIKNSNTETKFFAMSEQDDIYVSERLQWQVEVFQQHPEVGLVSGIAEFTSESNTVLFPGILLKKKQFPQGKELFRYLYVNQLKVVNTCMMIRSSVHLNHNLSFRSTYGNFNVDWDYVLRFALVSQVYGISKKLVVMNRKHQFNSVTTNKKMQHQMSRQLLKDFKQEFPDLIGDSNYTKALKMERKIELGLHTKFEIIGLSLYYSIRYLDLYFLKYLWLRIFKYLNIGR